MGEIILLGSIGGFLASAQLQILYWILAISGTVIFGAFMVLTIFGLGTLHDADTGPDGMMSGHADTGYSDFKLISLRSVMAFVTFFGWGGVVFGRFGVFGFIGAIGSGLFMMFITSTLVFVILRLQHSGNIKPDDLIGHKGSVYFGIPGGRANAGKVTIAIEGATVEIAAVADEAIPTGAIIVVVEHLDERMYLVKKV